MKALTIWQPSATLYVAGGKEDETRDWTPPPDFRGPLAIHSGNHPIDPANMKRLHAQIPSAQAVIKAHTRWRRAFPLGSILAVIETIRVWQVDPKMPKHTYNPGAVKGTDGVTYPITEANWTAGDLSPGRYCWRRGRVHLLKEPIECHGGKGLWDLPPPIEARVLEQVNLGGAK